MDIALKLRKEELRHPDGLCVAKAGAACQYTCTSAMEGGGVGWLGVRRQGKQGSHEWMTVQQWMSHVHVLGVGPGRTWSLAKLHGTFSLTFLPRGKQYILGNLVLKIKRGPSGEVERYKARFVARSVRK